MQLIKQIILEMRIKQWTKNLFVYAAILFHGGLFQFADFVTVTKAFLAFSLTASGVYFINDIFDIEKDRANPKKSQRPIASGKISKSVGYFCALLLFIAGLMLMYNVNVTCFWIVLSYVILNLLYTVKLKHVVIIDVMIISYGFVSRTIIGAVAVDIDMTIWFNLCVMFLSLFLALGKRRHELLSVKDVKDGRKVLQQYSVEFINQMMSIVTSAIIMCYSMFTMTSDDKKMVLTIPLVIYGMFYYLYIVRVKVSGGAPEEALYKEKPILLTVVLYVAYIILIRNI